MGRLCYFLLVGELTCAPRKGSCTSDLIWVTSPLVRSLAGLVSNTHHVCYALRTTTYL